MACVRTSQLVLVACAVIEFIDSSALSELVNAGESGAQPGEVGTG